MNTNMLALEALSFNPSVALYTSACGFRAETLLRSRKGQAPRYDMAFLVDHLRELVATQQLKPTDIQLLAYCAGPGPFSAIRASVVVVRLFRRLFPQIQIYKFGLLSLFAEHYRRNHLISRGSGQELILNLKAGLRGYFQEIYAPDGTIHQAARLIFDNRPLEQISGHWCNAEEQGSCSFAEMMLQLLHEGQKRTAEIPPPASRWAPAQRVYNLEEIQPEYLREPSTTEGKKQAK